MGRSVVLNRLNLVHHIFHHQYANDIQAYSHDLGQDVTKFTLEDAKIAGKVRVANLHLTKSGLTVLGIHRYRSTLECCDCQCSDLNALLLHPYICSAALQNSVLDCYSTQYHLYDFRHPRNLSHVPADHL